MASALPRHQHEPRIPQAGVGRHSDRHTGGKGAKGINTMIYLGPTKVCFCGDFHGFMVVFVVFMMVLLCFVVVIFMELWWF